MRRIAAVVLEWLLVTASSMLVMAAVYPDMLVTAEVRFTAGHDVQIPFQSAWLHAGYFLRDGVQLWNRLDQVNHAFFHLATGFQGLAPIAEGWLFSLFGDALARPGEAFQAFHPVAFFTLATLFRTAGGLALISLYPVPLGARIATLLLANTLLAAPTYNGVVAGFLYSLTPLALYFLILFFRRLSLVTLVWLVLALGLAFAQAPLLAVGYFYHAIHYFVIACLLAFAWWAWRARRDGAARPAGAAPDRRLAVALVLACGALGLAVVLAMDIHYLRLLTESFQIADSGLAGSQGRFERILDPIAYMTSGPPGPEVSELLSHALDFTVNRWWLSWQLIGAASLGLALIGLSHGGHRERWLYAAAFALTVLAQFPRTIPSWGLPAHAITGFTNPFAFLVVHTHMSMLLMTYFLIVPIGLGLAVLWRPTRAPVASGWIADAAASSLLLAGAVFALLALPLAAAAVAAAVFLGLALCLLASRIAAPGRGPWLRGVSVALPLAAITADLWGFAVYLEDVPYTGDRIQPRVFTGLGNADGREIGPVTLDYQNPATLTFPRHLRLAGDPVAPSSDPGFPTDHAVYLAASAYIGAFYGTVFLSRHFDRPRLYELRHARYAGASDPERLPEPPSAEDRALNTLMRRDDRALYFVPVSVEAARVSLADLVEADAGHWAVALTARDGSDVPGALPQLPEAPAAQQARAEEPRPFHFTLAEAVARREREREREGFIEHDFTLPDDFPGFLATNLFTADRDTIRLSLDGRELAPAQGHLIRPFTFDLRNVASERLVVALPADQPAGSRLRLDVAMDPLLRNVAPNRDDTTGLAVEAPGDGWLVWRAPYEDGWTARVDGAPAPVYIANRTAMAVALPAGRHQVVFAYKPGGSGSWTRLLVEAHQIASPLLAVLVLGMALVGAAAGHGRPPRIGEARDRSE